MSWGLDQNTQAVVDGDRTIVNVDSVAVYDGSVRCATFTPSLRWGLYADAVYDGCVGFFYSERRNAIS